MEDIDTKDQGRPVKTKLTRCNFMQIKDRLRRTCQRRPGEKHHFILPVRKPLLVILVILLLLPELFHQLAFPVTMHGREGFILAVFGILGYMRVIVGNDKEVTKGLRKKGCEEEGYN
jgi:hypothetical protein